MPEGISRLLRRVPGGKVTLLLAVGILIVTILPPPKRTSPKRDTSGSLPPAVHVAEAGRATAGHSAEGRASGERSLPPGETAAATARRVREKQSWGHRPWPEDPFWHGEREPVRRATRRDPRLNSLRLEGTFCGSAHPQALIEGQLLAPGDSIAGARIDRIAPGEAHLSRDGKTVILRLSD